MWRTLVQPIVTELVPVLEPVGRDPFIDGPDDPARCQSSRPVARSDLRRLAPDRATRFGPG
jgi:hypothetical protein